MLDRGLRSIAEAQVDRLVHFGAAETSGFLPRLLDADSPAEIRRAVLKEQPLIDGVFRRKIGGPDPAVLREEAVAAGVLSATAEDLAYRRLFPSLDFGVYAASHAMGRPSIALQPALSEAVAQLYVHGTNAWVVGGWLTAIENFRKAIAELCGADLLRGDVATWPNFSEGLAAVLCGLEGPMLTDASHFTSALYVQRAWAARTGNPIHEVALDSHGLVTTERLIAALTPQTSIVSISHVAWKTGYLYDLDAIGEAMAATCPDAILLLDVYQSLGTVPVSVARLPMRTAILGGGIKQLHAGPGAGFGWVSHELLALIEPDRTGWWAHENPLAFDPEFRLGVGAAKLRTGTSHPLPMIALQAELRVLASSAGGDLRAAVRRARATTQRAVGEAVDAARRLGLKIAGAVPLERRGAFLAIAVADGPKTVAAMAERGVIVDFRSDVPNGLPGLVRLSSHAAGFSYELVYAVETLAQVVR